MTHENFGKFMNIEFEFIKLFDRFMYLRFDQVEKLHKSRKMYNVFYTKCVYSCENFQISLSRERIVNFYETKDEF